MLVCCCKYFIENEISNLSYSLCKTIQSTSAQSLFRLASGKSGWQDPRE